MTNVPYNGWYPIGANYTLGCWQILWAKKTKNGWTFREGRIGLNHVEIGTPGGVDIDD